MIYFIACFCLLFGPLFSNDGRALDFTVVQEVSNKIESEGAIILMQHGEQKKSEQVLKLTSPAEQKIPMMRAPENDWAPITNASADEFVFTIAALGWVQKATQLPIHIESSANLRARQAAERAAQWFHVTHHIRSIWNCIDDLPEEHLSTEKLLMFLPDGTVSWRREMIDAVAGPMTYPKILEAVKGELKPSKTLRVVITHSQQLQAACETLGLPQSRLNHNGFVLITPAGPSLYPNGFFIH